MQFLELMLILILILRSKKNMYWGRIFGYYLLSKITSVNCINKPFFVFCSVFFSTKKFSYMLIWYICKMQISGDNISQLIHWLGSTMKKSNAGWMHLHTSVFKSLDTFFCYFPLWMGTYCIAHVSNSRPEGHIQPVTELSLIIISWPTCILHAPP